MKGMLACKFLPGAHEADLTLGEGFIFFQHDQKPQRKQTGEKTKDLFHQPPGSNSPVAGKK